MAELALREITCSSCRGYGSVCDYHGGDFHGEKACPTCKGQGHYYATASGRLILHTGGPFVGSLPREKADAR